MAGRSQMDPTAQIFAGREGRIDLTGWLATCSSYKSDFLER